MAMYHCRCLNAYLKPERAVDFYFWVVCWELEPSRPGVNNSDFWIQLWQWKIPSKGMASISPFLCKFGRHDMGLLGKFRNSYFSGDAKLISICVGGVSLTYLFYHNLDALLDAGKCPHRVE